MNLFKHIPNTLTLSNLFCGMMSIFFSSIHHNLEISCFFILLGAFFDFFDGMSARLLKVDGPLGLQLDSMADMVSFGVAPSMLMLQLVIGKNATEVIEWWHTIPFLIAVFTGLRLAIFNTDTTQSKVFKGLPSPASALLVIGLCFFPASLSDVLSQEVLLSISLILSYLLVSPIRMLSLKFEGLAFHNNRWRYALVILIVVICSIFKLEGISFVIFAYIILSVLYWLTHKNKSYEV